MAVDVTFDGTSGFARAGENDYDVVVLDRDLPAMHGDEICGRQVDGAAAAGCSCSPPR